MHRPNKQPVVMPADLWDFELPDALNGKQHVTFRLGSHGTVLQLPVWSMGGIRFSAGHEEAVVDIDAAGRVKEVSKAGGGVADGGGEGGERERWLDSWEDAEAVCRLTAKEGVMLVSSGPFEAEARDDQVPRTRCGRWSIERVYPGGNVCILHAQTSGLQIWLTTDGEHAHGTHHDTVATPIPPRLPFPLGSPSRPTPSSPAQLPLHLYFAPWLHLVTNDTFWAGFIFFGGEEGRGTMGMWGGGLCVGARRGEWRECGAEEARCPHVNETHSNTTNTRPDRRRERPPRSVWHKGGAHTDKPRIPYTGCVEGRRRPDIVLAA